MKKKIISGLTAAGLSLALLVGIGVGTEASKVDAVLGDTFELVTSADTLSAGDVVTIVSVTNGKVFGEQSGKYRTAASLTISSPGEATISAQSDWEYITLESGTNAGNFNLKTTEITEGYLILASNINELNTSTEATNDWSISVAADTNYATISPSTYATRSIQWNASNPRFACYSSNQEKVYLYRKASGTTANLTSVTLGGDMTNKAYQIGDEWDCAGLYITLGYDDGSSFDITDAAAVKNYLTFNPATANDLLLTSVTVTATYEGISSSPVIISGITVSERFDYTYDLVTNFATYASGWNSFYSSRTVESNELGGEVLNARLEFSAHNKQSSTITDRPVSKGGSVTFTLLDPAYQIKAINAEFLQWTTKGQSVNVEAGGVSVYSGDLSFTNSVATTGKITLAEPVSSFVVTATNSANQVGWTSFTIEVVEAAAFGELASIIVVDEPIKTVYSLNEALDLSGLQIMAYDVSGLSQLIAYDGSNIVVSAVDMTTTGKKDVTLSYTVGVVTKTATFSIYVVNYQYQLTGSSLSTGVGGLYDWGGLNWTSVTELPYVGAYSAGTGLQIGSSKKGVPAGSTVTLRSDVYSIAGDENVVVEQIIVRTAGYSNTTWGLTAKVGDSSEIEADTTSQIAIGNSTYSYYVFDTYNVGYIELEFTNNGTSPARLLIDSIAVIASSDTGYTNEAMTLIQDIGKADVCNRSADNITALEAILARIDSFAGYDTISTFSLYDYQDGDTSHAGALTSIHTVEAKVAYMRSVVSAGSGSAVFSIAEENGNNVILGIVALLVILTGVTTALVIVSKRKKAKNN